MLEKNVSKQNQVGEVSVSPRFLPVSKWNDYHPWPPQGGLRYLIFHEKTNGFSQCVVRVGKSVLIDEDAFVEWMRSKKEGK